MKRTRRALAVCLMICMLLSMPGITFAKGQDVEGHWAESTINIWVEKGLIQGFPDGNFKPENPMTRAEFFVLLNKCFGFYKTASSDVPDNALAEWFTEDLSIAKEQGYLEGLPEEMLKPNEPISRQEVVAILGKVLKLISDESAADRFADADLFASWARGYIGAATNFGYIKGYTNNTFRPEKNISRAEVVTVLHRSIGELYNAMGTFGPETSTTTITGNSTISKPNVVLRNQIIEGNLYLTEGIGEGTVTLDQVTVLGTTFVSGGGKGIVIKDASIGEVVVKGKNNPMVYLVAQGTSKIGTVHVQSNAKLEEDALKGTGFGEVISEAPEGGQLILAGDFDRVELKAALSQLSILKGTIKLLENNVKDAVIDIHKSARIDTLTVNNSMKETGKCSLGTANINASNVSIEATPEVLNIALGLSNVSIPKPQSLSGGGGGGGGGGSGGGGSTTPAVTIASVADIGNKTVVYGTSKEAIGLQTTIEVALSDGNKKTVSLTWNNGTPAYDGNIAGDYTFTGTLTMPNNVTNPNDIKATVKVTVEAPVPAVVKVTGVSLISDILLEQGTVSESVYLALYFPQEVGITLSNGKSPQVSVSWNYYETSYDGDKAAVYTFWGGLSLPDDVTNPDNLKARVNVVVGEADVIEVTSVESFKDIIVAHGTSKDKIDWPTSVGIILSDGNTDTVGVVWDDGAPNYDGTTKGTYEFKGALILPDGVSNSENVKAEIKVIVEAPVVLEVIEVESLTDITVANGTSKAEIGLPDSVGVTLSNNTLSIAGVVWDDGAPNYDGRAAETYVFEGILTPPDGVSNTANHKASIKVIVEPPVVVNIKGVKALADIKVGNGTAKAEIGLPPSVGILLQDDTEMTVAVIWDDGTPNYDETIKGTYEFKGTLTLPDGVSNSNNLTAKVNVTVLAGPLFTITEVSLLSDIPLVKGTVLDAVYHLPQEVTITLKDTTTRLVSVTWDPTPYDANSVGIYTLLGTLTLPEDVINPENKMAEIKVRVFSPIDSSFIQNRDPNPETPLNISSGTTILDLDSLDDWTPSDSAMIQIDTVNRVAGNATTHLSPLAPKPNTGTTQSYISAVTSGDLGGALEGIENIEFNLYIPEKEQIDYLLIKFYTDDWHGIFFENGIGGWELTPGWNKIRRIKDDFVFKNTVGVTSMNSISTMSLKRSATVSNPRTILQEQIDQLDMVLQAERERSLMENTKLQGATIQRSMIQSAAVETLAADSWGSVKQMEIFVVFQNEKSPTMNLGKIALNPRGAAKILFTFDDAWLSVLEKAYPIMEKKGFKGTTWVNKEGAVGYWDDGEFMNIQQLKQLYDDYGWDIGNHTTEHPDVISDKTDEYLKKIYQDNQQFIIDNGWLRGAHHVCYPSGQFDERLIEILKGIGVLTARTTIYGIEPPPVSNIYKLKCVAVGRDTFIDANGNEDRYVYDEIDRTIDTGSTLFFMFHRVEKEPEVDDGGENYGRIAVSIENFQALVDYIGVYKQQGKVEVVTISEWYDQYMGK